MEASPYKQSITERKSDRSLQPKFQEVPVERTDGGKYLETYCAVEHPNLCINTIIIYKYIYISTQTACPPCVFAFNSNAEKW